MRSPRGAGGCRTGCLSWPVGLFLFLLFLCGGFLDLLCDRGGDRVVAVELHLEESPPLVMERSWLGYL